MGVFVEVSVGSESVPFTTLTRRTESPLRFERSVPFGTSDPILSVAGSTDQDPRTGVAEAAWADPAVDRCRSLGRIRDRSLFRLRLNGTSGSLPAGIGRAGGSTLQAAARGDDWKFRLAFPSSDAVSVFRRHCQARGIDTEVGRVRPASEYDRSDRPHRYGLTEVQAETLTRAYERGYFDRPRGVTLEGLAAEFRVSEQAISGRLRRGMHRLVAETLIPRPHSE